MVAFTRIPYHEAIEREKKQVRSQTRPSLRTHPSISPNRLIALSLPAQASLLSTLVWASAAGVAVAAAGVFAAVALGRKGRSNL